MSDKEIEIYNENADEIKIRPYEHHAKYYETDQMGIIHHSNYIKWMEEARMDLMDQIGLSYKQMEEMEIIMYRSIPLYILPSWCLFTVVS